MKISYYTVATGIIALIAFACTPDSPTSSLDSLDNFANGDKFRDNICRISNSVTADTLREQPAFAAVLPPLGKKAENAPDNLQKLARETLTVVPDKVQELFVLLGGTITIIDTAEEICGNFYKDEGGNPLFLETDDLTSCAVFFPESSQNRRVLNIVLSPEKSVIQHGLLRAFSALMTEYFPRLSRNSDGSFRHIAQRSSDRQKKQELARSFLEDISDADGLNFENLIFAFGNVGIIELVDILKNQRYSNAKNLFEQISFKNDEQEQLSEAARLERENRMLNVITAEAFDSYYCNSWSDPRDNITLAVRSGERPITDLGQSYNTQAIFEKLFQKSFREFENSTIDWMDGIVSRLLPGSDSLGLVGEEISLLENSEQSRSSGSLSLADGYESPWWAGAKAFGGSIWDNTGGAVSRGYSGYKKAVTKAVDEVYDGNVASTAVKAIGKVGGDAYGNYYDSQYQKANDRMNTLQQGGMSASASRYYAVGLAAGDITGFTEAAEAIGGADTQQGRILSTEERYSRGLTSIPKIAGTMAGAVATTSRVAGAIKPTPLCLGPCNQIFTTNTQAVSAAKELGYRSTGKLSSKQTIMEATKKAPKGAPKYITRDISGVKGTSVQNTHNGGAFKGARKLEDIYSGTTRCGTYDACLNLVGK